MEQGVAYLLSRHCSLVTSHRQCDMQWRRILDTFQQRILDTARQRIPDTARQVSLTLPGNVSLILLAFLLFLYLFTMVTYL